jgi:hypothetical protein
MTPHKQLIMHKPEEGRFGDCWRTCIACLLDKHPDDVPHFLESGDALLFHKKTAEYLETQGLSKIEYVMEGALQDVLFSVGRMNPGMHYLLGGWSRTGCNHSVICCDGQIVWDPSLTDAGIVGPMDDGYYWITWLVPLFLRANREGGAA